MNLALSPVAHRRLSLTGRALAALFGGYAFAHAATAFLTLVLPFVRADRVIAATMLSFVVWCTVAVLAFTARTAWRAWAWIAAGALLMYGVAAAFPELASRP
jgi:hypothetical protein